MTPLPTPDETELDVDAIQPDPKELARHTDKGAVERLAANIQANGLLNALTVMAPLLLIAGHFRWMALKHVGVKRVRVRLYPALTALQIAIVRASENLHRRDYTLYQKHRVIADLLADNPEMQQKDVASVLNLDPATVTKLCAAAKLCDAAMKAFQEDKLTLEDVYALGRAKPEAQAGLLALRLNGGSIGELQKAARPKPEAPAARLSRVRLDVEGASLTLTGDSGLTLEQVSEAIAAAQAEVKRAIKQGMDVKALNALTTARKK